MDKEKPVSRLCLQDGLIRKVPVDIPSFTKSKQQQAASQNDDFGMFSWPALLGRTLLQ